MFALQPKPESNRNASDVLRQVASAADKPHSSSSCCYEQALLRAKVREAVADILRDTPPDAPEKRHDEVEFWHEYRQN